MSDTSESVGRASGRSRHPAVPPVVAIETGPIESAVLEDLSVHNEPGTAGLRATALRLARTLDGDAGIATAAVARELRATLEALIVKEPEGDNDALDRLITRMSAPLQHTAD